MINIFLIINMYFCLNKFMEQRDIIKNDKQVYYNQVKGVIDEMNDGQD